MNAHDMANFLNSSKNQRGSFRKSDHSGCILIITVVAIILLVVACIAVPLMMNLHSEPGKFTVTGRESINGRNSHKYLVYTDVTTYEITDSWIHWRWDSSDVYGNIEIGKTYTATLQGYRVPFLSMYQNIIDPVEVK